MHSMCGFSSINKGEISIMSIAEEEEGVHSQSQHSYLIYAQLLDSMSFFGLLLISVCILGVSKIINLLCFCGDNPVAKD